MGFNPFKSVSKAVKGVTKPLKKVLRSPVGKAAMMWAMYQYGPMMFGESAGGMRGLQGWQKGLAAKAPWLYTPATGAPTPSGASGILGKAAGFAKAHPYITAGAAAMGAGALDEDIMEDKKVEIDDSGHKGYLTARKGFIDEWTEWLIDQGHDPDEARAMAEKELFAKAEGGVVGLAQGGRIGFVRGHPSGSTGQEKKGTTQSSDRQPGFETANLGDTGVAQAGEGQNRADLQRSIKGLQAQMKGRRTTAQDYLDVYADPSRLSKIDYFNRPTPNIQLGGGGHGGQPTWQRLGYPSYAAWLAAQQSQGGGGTGTGGVGDYYGFKEWEDWEGAPTTPLFGDATSYQGLLSKGGRIGLYAGGMGAMSNSMNPMMNQGLGAVGPRGMNPYNQQNLMAQGQMRGQPGGMPGGRPPMPGGPTTAQGPGIPSARLPKQNEDNELLKLIRMLASMGIPMEQLRGRTKEELVEMVMSLSAKAEAQGGREEVVEEQEEVVEAAHGGRIRAAGGLGEMYPPQGSYPNSDLEFQTEEQASIGNPGNAEMYLEEEDDEEEIYVQKANGGRVHAASGYPNLDGRFRRHKILNEMVDEEEEIYVPKRVGKAMGTEQPIIPSRDGPQIDYRGIGGYQPHGAKEKKDDVRALLAQGEFVVTSDAVKGIGEGDRDLGAKRMYDMMHKYEPIGRALS